MNHVYLTGLRRRARNAVEERHRKVRKRGRKGLATMVRAMDIILDASAPKESRIINLFMEFDDEVLRDALAACRELHAIADHGYVDELRARHHHLKRYLTRFVALPFQGERGTAPLLAALKIARRMAAGEVARLPQDAPTGFVPGAWRSVLRDAKERIDLRVWELALAFAVNEALRSGDLYLPESRQHVSFWNLVYGADRWKERREEAYVELQLPSKPIAALATLQGEFDQAARELAGGLDKNPFAAVVDGELQLHKRDAIDQPRHVRELRRVVETHLPRIRIEDLLVEVDSWCRFTAALAPLGGYRPRAQNLYPTLLAALVAHGTNLGITTMAQSTEGITVDQLDHVSQRYLRPETLKAANKVLVDFHHRLPLSSAWGRGMSSSSDGQRFGVQASSLLASFYPRYFGYYDRAISVYTHVSDQFSAFSSRAISCSPREAIYVLDGLLENDTLLHPREHYTDTHGFTEHVFALCHLLGFSFMPRLKDLKDQQLWRMDRKTSYGAIDPLFSGTADTALIAEQWDQLVRVASSLRSRTAPAHVVLDRLAASAPADRLARAMTMLGRIVKTPYIMRYLHDPAMRDRGHLQLNRGESRHDLAQRLFFANQGAFRTGDYEEIMNKVSALALLANAVLVWNTVRIDEIVRGLEGTTGKPVPLEDIARVSPLAHAHVIPSGTYRFPVRARHGAHPNG